MSVWTERKYNLTPLHKPYKYSEMPAFRLGRNVRENIKALRSALGSATRELSRDDLARLINDELPQRSLTGSTVRWWEKGRGQPEYRVAAVMARLAGCSFEQFCLGTGEPVPNEAPADESDRGLSDEEAARAIAADERGTRQQAPPRKAAGARKRHRRP